MDFKMETSPSYYDPEDLTSREQYRRYGKRLSTSPYSENSAAKSGKSRILTDGHNVERRANTTLLLEDIKQEVEGYDVDYTPSGGKSISRRRNFTDPYGMLEMNNGDGYMGKGESYSKYCKVEDGVSADDGESTFAEFASLLDSALQGSVQFPDLILHFERVCRDVSESLRYGSSARYSVVEDKIMRQKAKLLLDEAASWSLLWFLFGKGNDELPEDLLMTPSTSHLEACQFVANDHTAQLCLRVVQWLEGLASKALDLENKVRGSHVGTYLPSSGVWHHTQRLIKRGISNGDIVQHMDFDAPTREHAKILPDDKKQDETLLEDIWILLKAGRFEEACELCRSAGQPWRAATLSSFGGADQFPSIGVLIKNGKDRRLQAIESESGIGHHWLLWKWACFCASERIAEQDGGKYESAVFAVQCSNLKRTLPICTDWESACWAIAKSWLDYQVDYELAQLQPGRGDILRNNEEATPSNSEKINAGTHSLYGPEQWPLTVGSQQPRNVEGLLQKLHSSDTVHEAVARECKEHQRQIEMHLMMGDIPVLLDLIWSWASPADDDQSSFRPYGDPDMLRFGAHLVLILRHLLADPMTDIFREKIMNMGDLIINMYAMFLFTKQHEELVGIYASQLARHRCIDLFVHMMELRLNSSVHVKYEIFLSAIEYLPFSPEDDSKASFEEIIERVLSRSREIKAGKYDDLSDIAEQFRLQSLQKAMVIQWLCFTPPSTILDVKRISAKLLSRALIHSNILFREFALISMWRVPALPIGAHKLLSFLAEPLKQLAQGSDITEEYDMTEGLKEFQDWSEYYSCDATYRNWLKFEVENAEVSSDDLSSEEKIRATVAAKEALESSLSLLKRADNPWLIPAQDIVYESQHPVFLELHATAILCPPSGGCLDPDATICAALMSAIYSSVGEAVVLSRELMVNVSMSQRDNHCIEIALRCSAVEGDGLGSHDTNDGGLLATVLAAGFKGELARFQAGVTMEISRLDAWYTSLDGTLEGPAIYVIRGLCRKCCIPELILRCMQVSVSLVESGNPPETHDELIELVASSEYGYLHLFSQNQLQEILLFEREYYIHQMELQETSD
uniref:Nuclear pore complex protein n=2 Tax=Kalanchoe fedtschenkoi TaxID=63787 RepID=A0A7N0RJF5_KALFE